MLWWREAIKLVALDEAEMAWELVQNRYEDAQAYLEPAGPAEIGQTYLGCITEKHGIKV